MRFVRVGLVRRTHRNDGLAADEARPVSDRLCRLDRPVDSVDVVTVHMGHDVPAVGLESLRRVVGEPRLDVSVDRDAIVVVEHDQLAEAECPRERAGLVRDALHEAAVAAKRIGVVVDDVVARSIECGGKDSLRECHADRIGEALAERPGRRLDARRAAVFGMPGRLRMQLAKAPQLVHRQVVAGEMQQRVKQHGAMTVREHEAVAVRPFRIGRVMAQMAVPERQRDLGHAHRHARMPGVRLLHGIHGERAQYVGEIVANRSVHRGETLRKICERRVRLTLTSGNYTRGAPLQRARGAGSDAGFQTRVGRNTPIACSTGPRRAPIRLRSSIKRQIIGVMMSCIASSSLPPGTTILFGRDMNELLIIVKR